MNRHDDFLQQMGDHSPDLSQEDKNLLLRLAAEMASTNRKIKEAKESNK